MPGIKLREDPKIPSNILFKRSEFQRGKRPEDSNSNFEAGNFVSRFLGVYIIKKKKKKFCIKYNYISFDRQSLVAIVPVTSER